MEKNTVNQTDIPGIYMSLFLLYVYNKNKDDTRHFRLLKKITAQLGLKYKTLYKK